MPNTDSEFRYQPRQPIFDTTTTQVPVEFCEYGTDDGGCNLYNFLKTTWENNAAKAIKRKKDPGEPPIFRHGAYSEPGPTGQRCRAIQTSETIFSHGVGKRQRKNCRDYQVE